MAFFLELFKLVLLLLAILLHTFSQLCILRTHFEYLKKMDFLPLFNTSLFLALLKLSYYVLLDLERHPETKSPYFRKNAMGNAL